MAELDLKERQAGDVTILDMMVRCGSVKARIRCVMRSGVWRRRQEEDSAQSRRSEVHGLEWYRRVDCELHDCQLEMVVNSSC